jgi:hypothetical protein
MRNVLLPLALLAPLVAGACGHSPPSTQLPAKAAPPPRPVVVEAPPPPAPEPSPLVSLKTQARVPDKFALDGDVAEWGSLVPPPPPPPPPPAKGKSAPAPAPAPPPSPNAVDAPSHVAVVLSPAGITLAAELVEASQDGAWLGLGFGAPELPPIGHFQRGGGVMELNCEADMSGEPLPPEVQKDCRDTLDQHAAFVAAYEARFERFFRLDESGLSALGEDGKLHPVEGAKAAVKKGGKKLTLEATLPTSTLPRASSAPIDGIRLFARATDAKRPPVPKDEEWVWLDVQEPVDYEPFAKLRAVAFNAPTVFPVPMSYQPGDPLGVEVIGYAPGSDGTALEPRSKTLYSPLSKLGDLEIGQLFMRRPALVILRNGEIVDTIEVPGEPAGFIVRNKDLHVFFYERYTSTDIWAEMASWHVFGIKPTGAYDEIIAPSEDNRPWTDDVEEFHSPKFDSFGIRGTPMFSENEGERPSPVEITWRFDAKEGAYFPKTRALPVRKSKKAR